MRQWTIAPKGGAGCGYCGRWMTAGEPLQVITFPERGIPARYRCVDHAIGAVNDVEVDLERDRLERAQERAALQQPDPRPHADRQPPPPAPKPFAAIAELAAATRDPRAAQAGRDD